MTQPLPDQVPASEPDPLDVIAQANDLASLDEELNQLPQKYRDVLVMSYFAQQTNQEIADQLNESKGAIDGRIRDARRMLRVRLARRGVEVGVLAVAAAYVQSSASAASPALIQKAISLGAPGLISQELAALNAAEVAQMKFLTSTGVPLMSKIGLTITAGLVLATGLWGMTKLAAFQDGVAGGGAAAVLDATAEDGAKGDESTVELSGQTGPAATTEQGGGEVPAVAVSAVATQPDSGSGMISVDGSGMGSGEMSASKPRRKLSGAAAEFSRSSERDAERRLNELMQTEYVENLNFPGENPLVDILEQLSSTLSRSQGQPVLLHPDIGALDDDAINLEDVMIKDIQFPAELKMTVGSALDYILSQTDPKLTWIAKDELVLITTLHAAESEVNMFLRSYDISRLREISQLTVTAWTGGGIGGGMGGGGMGGGGMGSGGMGGGGGGYFSVAFAPTQFGGDSAGGGGQPVLQKTSPSKPDTHKSKTDDTDQQIIVTWEAGLMQTIQDMTGPPIVWYEIDGEGGKMSVAGNRLLVRQSRKGHEQVVAVLEQLEMAAEDAAAEASAARAAK